MIIGASYAYIAYTTRQKGINVLETNCINVTMEELTNEMRLTNAYPLTDENGMQTKPFRFKLTNTCGVGVDYNLNLEVMNTENRIASKNIAVKVDENNKSILNSNPSATPTYKESDYTAVESYTTYSGSINPYDEVTHEVRIWLDESAGNDSQNGSFYSKVVIEAKQNQMAEYKEEILNGADPVLSDNLIPVEIDETGKVTKANIQNEWYSYAEKKWANAVILEDESITYQEGEEIPESNIESYFVWIPKYSYQLWDLGEYTNVTNIDETKPHIIPIKFGLTNTNDNVEGECTTPMTSGATGNCQIGEYMTPPAFITMGTNGLWVGKFETGYKGATTAAEAQVNANDSSKVEIKSNVRSWKGINVSNAFYTSYNYKRELDSHMMKNTEWGAVAYLQHSQYGSATSVRINNNGSRVTGYAGVEEPTIAFNNNISIEGNRTETIAPKTDGTYTINYLNPNSQVASTTGNYSGIYDMSGGANDYVMGVRGDITEGSADFSSTNSPEAKYYDIYNGNSTQTTYQYRILGDATAEFAPSLLKDANSDSQYIVTWYSDNANFIYPERSWFTRGGASGEGILSGIFSFSNGEGGRYNHSTFRIVLAI